MIGQNGLIQFEYKLQDNKICIPCQLRKIEMIC